ACILVGRVERRLALDLSKQQDQRRIVRPRENVEKTRRFVGRRKRRERHIEQGRRIERGKFVEVESAHARRELLALLGTERRLLFAEDPRLGPELRRELAASIHENLLVAGFREEARQGLRERLPALAHEDQLGRRAAG